MRVIILIFFLASCNGGGGGGSDSNASLKDPIQVSAIANTEAKTQVQSNLSETKAAIKNDPTEAARAISSEELNAVQSEANLTEDDIAFLTSLQEGE